LGQILGNAFFRVGRVSPPNRSRGGTKERFPVVFLWLRPPTWKEGSARQTTAPRGGDSWAPRHAGRGAPFLEEGIGLGVGPPTHNSLTGSSFPCVRPIVGGPGKGKSTGGNFRRGLYHVHFSPKQKKWRGFEAKGNRDQTSKTAGLVLGRIKEGIREVRAASSSFRSFRDGTMRGGRFDEGGQGDGSVPEVVLRPGPKQAGSTPLGRGRRWEFFSPAIFAVRKGNHPVGGENTPKSLMGRESCRRCSGGDGPTYATSELWAAKPQLGWARGKRRQGGGGSCHHRMGSKRKNGPWKFAIQSLS